MALPVLPQAIPSLCLEDRENEGPFVVFMVTDWGLCPCPIAVATNYYKLVASNSTHFFS